MPTPAGVLRANITASIQGGETMVHTLHFRIPDQGSTPDQGQLQAYADRLQDRWYAMMFGTLTGQTTPIRTCITVDTRYSSVDVYYLGPDGKATGQAQSIFPQDVRGAATTNMPTEVAVCCTLRTGLPGRSQQGRLYAGGLNAGGLDNSGRLNPQHREAFATGLAAFFSAVKGEEVFPMDAVVYSRLKGAVREITQVSVGDVYDVQRRRRNRLQEARQSATVSA